MNRSGNAAGTPPAAHDGWIVVETLADPGVRGTVVTKDGRAKDWTALQRAVPNRRTADAARSLVASVFETAEPRSTTVQGLGNSLRALPICGPRRPVHGVMLYTGDDPDAQPPAVLAYDWSSADRQFYFTADVRDVPTPPIERSSATAFEFFDRVEDPDSAMYLIVALLDAGPGWRWDGVVSVRSPTGPTPIHNVFRTVRDDASALDTVSHGLAVPLRRDEVMAPGPSVDALALRSLTRNSPTAIALIDAERVRVIRWLTDPVPNILWKGQMDRRDTPHPDDIVRIVDSYRRMHEWLDRGTVIPKVRLRRVDKGWTVVDLRATRIPGQRFLLVEFQPVGYSDDPDPVPATDTGYPGRGPRLR